MSKSVAKAKSTAVAEMDKFGAVPATIAGDIDEYAGAGHSKRSEDYVMPFLAICQKGSPQLNKKDPKYIDGIEVGDLFNTATLSVWPGEDHDAGVLFVPAHFLKFDVQWWPRTEGGGYVGTHKIGSDLSKKARTIDGRRMLPDGTQLVETAYYFGIVQDTGDPAVVAMASTGLGTSRQWQTLMSSFKVKNSRGELVKAPSFARVYRLNTVFQKNDKGDWYNWKVRDEGWIDTSKHLHVYNGAKDFYKVVSNPDFVMGRPAESSEGPLENDENSPI